MKQAKADHHDGLSTTSLPEQDPLVEYLLKTKQIHLYSTLYPTASETQLSGRNIRNIHKLGKNPHRYLDALRPATLHDSEDVIFDRLECLLDFPSCAQEKLTPTCSLVAPSCTSEQIPQPRESFPHKKNGGLRRWLNILKSLRHSKKSKDFAQAKDSKQHRNSTSFVTQPKSNLFSIRSSKHQSSVSPTKSPLLIAR
ncbi:hypothetical protein DSO57_1010963 [Entomophthora muscae]|uniref:Uncharacterized protein n=1 Tax=Entomophthora muscae TaxID=34485 RepID=A0ACC2UF83_9FUNG|nr:hypothetical protein DSO57_1010963 [Entomophthora muscae]